MSFLLVLDMGLAGRLLGAVTERKCVFFLLLHSVFRLEENRQVKINTIENIINIEETEQSRNYFCSITVHYNSIDFVPKV